jgi:hypothetical protein
LQPLLEVDVGPGATGATGVPHAPAPAAPVPARHSAAASCCSCRLGRQVPPSGAGASAPGSGRQGPLWACGRPGPRLGGGLRGIWGRGGRPSLFLADRSGPSGRRRSQFARRPVHPVLAGPDRRGEPSRLPGVGRAPRGRAGPTVVLIGRRRRPGRPDRRAGPRRPDGPRTCPARPLGRHLPLPPPGCRARWASWPSVSAPPAPRRLRRRLGPGRPLHLRGGAGLCRRPGPVQAGRELQRSGQLPRHQRHRPGRPLRRLRGIRASTPRLASADVSVETRRSRPSASASGARPRPRPGRLGRHRLDRSLRRHRVDRNPHRHRVDWALRRYRGRPGPPLARTTRS